MKNVSYKYLEIAHKKTGLSFYALAKEIGVSSIRVNQTKNDKSELNDGQLFKLAQLAQVAPSKVIAEAHIKKSKNPEEKAFWGMVAHSADLAKKSASYILCSIQNNIRIC
jgi:transcriptional regulator with XRE-family HTH domain